MSSRPILSRPRTRIYDANYNLGENYYKPTIDRLDRKYSGRPTTPPRSTSSIAQDILDRHDRAFHDEDLSGVRRRTEKLIHEPSIFDSRGGRISSAALEDSFDEEISSAVQRIRANKKVSVIDDIDMENTVDSLTSRRIKDRADKLLDTVGIVKEENVSGRRSQGEDVIIKRRSLRISQEDATDAKDLTKWTPLLSDRGAIEEESLAKQRATATKTRLNEIEEEMTALADKQAARERRAARLKALVAESAQQNEEDNAAVQSIRITARKEKRTVEF